MNLICRVVAVLGAFAFLLPTTGLAAGNAGLKQDLIKIGVGVDPAFSPIYYAIQNRMFERAGLNVQMLQLAQAADALDGVIAGQNQIAGGSETTVITRAARGDIRALAVFGQSSKFIKLVVRNDITDPRQIKKLGVVPGSASEFSSGKMIAKYGMDEKAITWVKGPPPEFPALLSRGDIDAYFLWEPWPTRGVALGGKVLLNSGDVGYSYNMLVSVSGKWFDQNQAEAKAFVGVLSKACEEIRAQPEKAALATQAMVKIPVAQARELLKDVECVVRDFTPADIKTYNEVADFLHSRKSTATRVDIDKLVKSGFISDNAKR